ncbi:MAG: hypothetical protein K0S30_213 [Clostridia bacterium]|jgi:hypothetical protein|nr:hypothetical protein [Clostridia bacterium]
MISKGCGLLVDQDKIILMTKLAVYEKRYIKEDERRNSYYLEDYVYINNFRTRFSVTLAVIVVAMVNIIGTINQNLIFPTSLMHFIEVYINPYLLPWILVVIGYTMLSAIIYGKRYALSQKRLKGYNKLLKQLDAYEQQKANEERAEYETE